MHTLVVDPVLQVYAPPEDAAAIVVHAATIPWELDAQPGTPLGLTLLPTTPRSLSRECHTALTSPTPLPLFSQRWTVPVTFSRQPHSVNELRI